MSMTTQYEPVAIQSQHPGKYVPVHFFHCQFTELVRNWTIHLQHKAWQITGNKQVAEDIVQEAFLSLWQNSSRFVPENPVSWLSKIVTNLAIRYVRDRNIRTRIHRILQEEINISITEVEELLIGKEKYNSLIKIFNQLPSQQKIVLQLSREQGMKRTEIAASLRLSPNTVKVHLHRAIQFMKENIPGISVFVLLFICHHIFFNKSNTNEGFMEVFTKKYLESSITGINSRKVELPDNKNWLAGITQATINSINR